MIEIIVGIDKDLRTKKRQEVLANFVGEVISLSDIDGSLSTLETYIYPSLFSVIPPVVLATYLIEDEEPGLTKEFLKKVISSPTVFILEEKSLPAALVKLVEKEGGFVHQTKGEKKVAKISTIFNVADALILQSKKERWLAYQKARGEHSAEAIVGILYWKLRQLVEGTRADSSRYKEMYRNLIQAHKTAWQKGFPLELAIEKVILER